MPNTHINQHASPSFRQKQTLFSNIIYFLFIWKTSNRALISSKCTDEQSVNSVCLMKILDASL